MDSKMKPLNRKNQHWSDDFENCTVWTHPVMQVASLSQGRHTWKHNQVLKCLAALINTKRTGTKCQLNVCWCQRCGSSGPYWRWGLWYGQAYVMDNDHRFILLMTFWMHRDTVTFPQHSNLLRCTCVYIYIYIYIRAVNRLKYLIAWLSRVNLWLIAINRTFLFVLNVPSINTFQVFNTPINIYMNKYDALCICMFIIIKTIVNSIKTRHVF